MILPQRTLALIFLLAALGSTLALPTVAAASNSRPTLAEVEEDVMCTVCGVPLSLAREAPAAKRQRALITSLIAQGMTKSEIEDQLVETYGQQVLATPKPKGFDIWAWIVPGAAFVLAVGGLGYLLVRWSRNRGNGDSDSESQTPGPLPLSNDDAAMVDAALKAQD